MIFASLLESIDPVVYYALGHPRVSTFELGFKAFVFITLLYFLSGINGVVGVAQSFLCT
tara:strand:+ start:366 stop:542 length:177 start_codon:yes stop_codon:yes gene_type:complete